MIRNLNINELEDKIHSYSLSIEYLDAKDLDTVLNQFINFLKSQPISNRIIERISEDYISIADNLPKVNTPGFESKKRDVLIKIMTPDDQGALGCFLILQTFKDEKRGHMKYVQMTMPWIRRSTGNYNDIKEGFITKFFKPFIELLEWYLQESTSYDSNDFFSHKEIDEISEKVDNAITLADIRLGQEVIFNEINDLKEQLKHLKKKNWQELLKGKLIDLSMSKIISIKTMSVIIKAITDQEMTLIE